MVSQHQVGDPEKGKKEKGEEEELFEDDFTRPAFDHADFETIQYSRCKNQTHPPDLRTLAYSLQMLDLLSLTM
jgi:hypothetical protein